MRKYFNLPLYMTLAFEVGYVNHPDDPGGYTNNSVPLTSLRRYQLGATVADLKRFDTPTLCRIYRDGYRNKVEGDRLAAACPSIGPLVV